MTQLEMILLLMGFVRS